MPCICWHLSYILPCLPLVPRPRTFLPPFLELFFLTPRSICGIIELWGDPPVGWHYNPMVVR